MPAVLATEVVVEIVYCVPVVFGIKVTVPPALSVIVPRFRFAVPPAPLMA